eukprot:6664651-Pyramimonas_sp.AAC.1
MVASESAGAPATSASPFGGHVEILDMFNICRLPRDGHAEPFCQIDVVAARGRLLEQLVGAILEGHTGAK